MSSRTSCQPVGADFTIDQPWDRYTAEDHGIWRRLFERQASILGGRACAEFTAGLEGLGVAADGIPSFAGMSEILLRQTGWRIVAVPGLVPDDIFFRHLANRRFPAVWWIRRPEQMDYLQEPDVFHDIYGHVPLLMNPVFADYMQAYGEGGLKADHVGALANLARLYWYTVEFGLIATSQGLRIYGSGILSSKAETVFSLESNAPNRVHFDLLRILRTHYRIDSFQKTYFVIDGFEQLFKATAEDFTGYYKALPSLDEIPAGVLVESDRIVTRGTGEGWGDTADV